jgi:uncharacterized membrane protein
MQYTELFKKMDVKVTFTTDNTIERRLAMKHGTDQTKCDKSGIYQLTYPDCKMKYTVQTERPLKIIFQERLRNFKYGNNKSKFAQHLLENFFFNINSEGRPLLHKNQQHPAFKNL